MKKRKIKKNVLRNLIVLLIIYIGIMLVVINKKDVPKDDPLYMISLIGKNEEEVKDYAAKNKLRLNINYVYSDSNKGVSEQDIKESK